jgi:CheY-like chemotaxis protein
MEMYATDFGCQIVDCVDNGDDAIKIVEEKRPDLILMDIRIEGDKDGIDTMMLIGQKFDIPCIYTTGNSDAASMERAKKTNMLGFLVKPVSKEDLLSLFK